jgi:hypothetical protein
MPYLVRFFLGLYPPWWRRQYGNETRELTEELMADPETNKLRTVGSLFFGAATAWTQVKRRADYLEPAGASGPSTLPTQYPPNPQDVVTASRRGHGRAIVVGVVAGLVCVVLAGVVVWAILTSFVNGLSGINVAPLFEGAAVQARSADFTARAHHIFDGALTLDLLNGQHDNVKWLPGGDSVPVSGKTTYVSISVGGDHVFTAVEVNRGACEYGLTVSAVNDAIIGQEHLQGVGTYWAIEVPGSVKTCTADSAPTSVWNYSNDKP